TGPGSERQHQASDARASRAGVVAAGDIHGHSGWPEPLRLDAKGRQRLPRLAVGVVEHSDQQVAGGDRGVTRLGPGALKSCLQGRLPDWLNACADKPVARAGTSSQGAPVVVDTGRGRAGG
ncbi:MAG TPA: hypothetical protein VFN61_05910, partial [Acidimicrobiales bacterium]|nr:hypothetical protein [Acidimicrobiales bacterium]